MPEPSAPLDEDSHRVGDNTEAPLVGAAPDAPIADAPATAEVSDKVGAAEPAAMPDEPQLLPPPPLDVATPPEMETVVRLLFFSMQCK